MALWYFQTLSVSWQKDFTNTHTPLPRFLASLENSRRSDNSVSKNHWAVTKQEFIPPSSPVSSSPLSQWPYWLVLLFFWHLISFTCLVILPAFLYIGVNNLYVNFQPSASFSPPHITGPATELIMQNVCFQRTSTRSYIFPYTLANNLR